jgi:predicted nucleotidyltransferase
MNFLGQILSSNVRAEFFRLLFGINRQHLHLREIERRSGFAIGTVQQEAAKLIRLELIRQQRDGNRVYFYANTQHPLFLEISNLVLKTVGLADVFKNTLQDPLIDYAFIFGSIAADNQKAESDIDLFIIGKIGFRALSKLLQNMSVQLGREINSNVMTVSDFVHRKHQNEHFITNVMKSPKLMITGTEDELAGLGK